jgi:uncharacterized protein
VSADGVTWEADRGRYELRREGELIAFADVVAAGDGRVVMPHTVTLPPHGGQGHASRLVGEALDDLRERGVTQVVPACWFVADFLRAHPRHADLAAR